MKSIHWTKKDCFIEDPPPPSASLLRDSFWQSTSETESARFHQHLVRICCSGATRLWTWFTVPVTAAPAPTLAGSAGCLSLGSISCWGPALRLPSYTAKLAVQSWVSRGVGVGAERLSRLPPASLFVCPLSGDRSSLLPLTFLCRFDELLSGVRVAGAGSGGRVRWGAVLPRVGCRRARATGGGGPSLRVRPWPRELIRLIPPLKAIAPQPRYLCPFLTGQGSTPPPSPTLFSPRPLLPRALHLAVRGPRLSGHRGPGINPAATAL